MRVFHLITGHHRSCKATPLEKSRKVNEDKGTFRSFWDILKCWWIDFWSCLFVLKKSLPIQREPCWFLCFLLPRNLCHWWGPRTTGTHCFRNLLSVDWEAGLIFAHLERDVLWCFWSCNGWIFVVEIFEEDAMSWRVNLSKSKPMQDMQVRNDTFLVVVYWIV